MTAICNLVENGTSRQNLFWLLETNARIVSPVVDLSDITRMVLTIDGEDIDSDVVGASVIDWTADTGDYPYSGADNAVTADQVTLVLGAQGLTAGVHTKCRLTIYSPTYPSGYIWYDDLVFPVLASGASRPTGPTWGELLDQARADLDDHIYEGMDGSDTDLLAVTDADFYKYAERAEAEACLRSKMIRDDSTAAVCSIAVTDGTRRYALHESIIDIERITISSRNDGQPLEQKSADWLDRNRRGWETQEGVPQYWIWDQVRSEIILTPIPEEDATISMSVTRYPIAPPCEDWVPELPPKYRWFLLDWIYHLIYSRRDEAVADPKKAAEHAGKFAVIFGDRPDVELLELRARSDVKKVRARFF